MDSKQYAKKDATKVQNERISLNSHQNDHWESLKDIPFNPEVTSELMTEEYEEMLGRYEREYATFMNPFVEKFSKENAKEIDEAFGCSYEIGCQETVRIFSELLDIEQPPLRLQTITDKSKIRQPYLDSGTGIITIPRLNEADNYENNRDRYLSDALDIVSHEMWHAHQRDVIKKEGERSEIYKKEFNNYTDVKQGVKDYFRQTVELEAYIFSDKIFDKFFDSRLEAMWGKYNKTKSAIEDCKTNGNEHLVDFLVEDNQKLLSRLKKWTGTKYFKKRMEKKKKEEAQ